MSQPAAEQRSAPAPWDGKCARRLKSCRQCQRRFSKDERHLWRCPACGQDRHCLHDPANGLRGQPCHLHGGRSLKGAAHPSFKGKGFSKYLPAGLSAKFEEAQADPNLLRLRDEAALLRLRQTELAARIGGEESGAAWAALSDAWDRFEAASQGKDPAAMQAALAEIGQVIRRGAGRDAAWNELVRFAHDRAAIVRGEADIAHKMSQVLTMDQANALAMAMGRAVAEEVKDRVILSRIAVKFARLLGQEPPQRIVEQAEREPQPERQVVAVVSSPSPVSVSPVHVQESE